MSLLLRTLVEATSLHALLDWPLDVRLLSNEEKLGSGGWYIIEAQELFEPVAEDGTTGRLLLGRSSGAVLFISSEGEAGMVAASLEEFLQLLLLPVSWRDLLKFSGGGQLLEMQRCMEALAHSAGDDDLEHAEQLASAQIELSQTLHLTAAPDALQRLHHAVSNLSERVRVAAPDGTPFAGLFNSLTVDTLLRRRTCQIARRPT